MPLSVLRSKKRQPAAVIKSPISMHTKKLILASGSPRRNELLGLLGVPFTKRPAEINERKRESESPREYVERMASEKGSAHVIGKDEIVLSADTIVELDGLVIGKPADEHDAWRILKLLRGETHHVFTALSLHLDEGNSVLSDISQTLVTMREYSDSEIKDYISREEYADKAGGYAIQDPLFHPVREIRGCYSNVMGLPLCHMFRLFKQAGISLDVEIAGVCQRYNDITCEVYPSIVNENNYESNI